MIVFQANGNVTYVIGSLNPLGRLPGLQGSVFSDEGKENLGALASCTLMRWTRKNAIFRLYVLFFTHVYALQRV